MEKGRWNDEQIMQIVKDFVIGKTAVEIATYNIRKERENAQLTSGIKGFLEYRINYKKNYKTDISKCFDADMSELTMSIWSLLLETSANVQKIKHYKGRKITYLDRSGLERTVETDTINSFSTSFNKFAREYIKEKFGHSWAYLYQHGYMIHNGKAIPSEIPLDKIDETNENRDKWLLKFYDEIFHDAILSPEEMAILQAFEVFANWTHTIGNFMIGPVGFNKEKNRIGEGDRLDIFFSKVRDLRELAEWKKEFVSYMDVNFIDMYFAGGKFIGWEDADFVNLRKGKTMDWLTKINKLIEARGIVIANRLIEIVENYED